MTETHVAQQPGTGHAVVIGASMAGLLAARVLAGHVERVTVVERDRLPVAVEHRKGVPQGRQLHVLLARGLAVLDRLFPGYSRDLEAAGAVPLRVPADLLMLTPAGWLDRRAPGWTALSASRPVMETAVRRRIAELPGVTLLERHEVTAPVASDGGRVVRGVTVRSIDGGDTSSAEADLVVDASGRGSRAPTWLTELGCPAPEQSQVDPDTAYATRVYRIPEGFTADWKAVMLASRPPSFPRTGYLFPIEDRQWMLTLMGAAGEHPPADEAGFTAFVRSLRSPVIAEAVAAAEPVTEVRAHHGTTNRQWHYERMRRWPEGFVVLGDAVSAFNPIYGQGMTTAANAAEALDSCLRAQRRHHREGDLHGLARRFQRELARRNADPWMLSTGEDLRFPTTTGMAVSTPLRLQHHYLDRVVTAATRDPAVADVYVRALGMLDRPTALFRPRVLTTALRTRPVSVERATERVRAPEPVAEVPAPRTPTEQRMEARS